MKIHCKLGSEGGVHLLRYLRNDSYSRAFLTQLNNSFDSQDIAQDAKNYVIIGDKSFSITDNEITSEEQVLLRKIAALKKNPTRIAQYTHMIQSNVFLLG